MVQVFALGLAAWGGEEITRDDPALRSLDWPADAPFHAEQVKARGFIATGVSIVQKESPLGLYKGLGAVVSGIVPKMAIRFASFEQYKGLLANKQTGKTGSGGIFLGKLRPPLVPSVAHAW